MRLKILNNGYGVKTKILFSLIQLFSRQPFPDAAKLVFYNPYFYGAIKHTHEAMRGASSWSIGDRELMAAFVAKLNECPFCIKAHSTTAAMAYKDKNKVVAVLSDLKTAPIGEELRATLRMLQKLTIENTINANDMREVLEAGVSPEQIEDALEVCFAFNITTRLANAFDFEILSPKGFEAGAKFLLKRGYK
jgi:uncharacterized peroxidase-related enzyme